MAPYAQSIQTIGYAANAASTNAISRSSAAAAMEGVVLAEFQADAFATQTWPPLWSASGPPHWHSQSWKQLENHLRTFEGDIWTFWRRWLVGLAEGAPLPWPLIHRIALELSNEDWQAEPAHVAKRIREIEIEFYGGAPLDTERVKERVRELLRDRVHTADMAEGAGNLLEKGIREYKEAAPANCLPDGLEPLEALPGQFWAIASVVRMDAEPSEREQALEAEIKNLHARIAELEHEAAKAKSLGAKFVETWTLGMAKTLSDKWFLGGLGMGAAFFFGVDPMDLKLANVKGYINDLMNAVPEAPPAPDLPPIDEA